MNGQVVIPRAQGLVYWYTACSFTTARLAHCTRALLSSFFTTCRAQPCSACALLRLKGYGSSMSACVPLRCMRPSHVFFMPESVTGRRDSVILTCFAFGSVYVAIAFIASPMDGMCLGTGEAQCARAGETRISPAQGQGTSHARIGYGSIVAHPWPVLLFPRACLCVRGRRQLIWSGKPVPWLCAVVGT